MPVPDGREQRGGPGGRHRPFVGRGQLEEELGHVVGQPDLHLVDGDGSGGVAADHREGPVPEGGLLQKPLQGRCQVLDVDALLGEGWGRR